MIYMEKLRSAVFLTTLCGLVVGNRLLTFKSPEEFLNVCMDGISHKEIPGPESALFEQCSPWKERSCCTDEITKQIHANQTWYKMNWSHCPQPLSAKCRQRFVQDLCFYECEPNVGPWLVKIDGMKIRNERFVDVPLCHTECDAWWEDCKDDYTCVENWSRQFSWTTGLPTCPSNKQCKPFREMYANSTDFCETVWDHSFKVVNDSTPTGCFLVWWTEKGNPNYEVAYMRAKEIISSDSRIAQLQIFIILVLPILYLIL